METTGITSLQERRKLNEEIEKTFIETSYLAVNIQTYDQTERGMTILDLYEGFYSGFAYLVILTSDLPQLKQSEKETKEAIDWIKTLTRHDDDNAIKQRLKSGVEIFMNYKRTLTERGVIALPPR